MSLRGGRARAVLVALCAVGLMGAGVCAYVETHGRHAALNSHRARSRTPGPAGPVAGSGPSAVALGGPPAPTGPVIAGTVGPAGVESATIAAENARAGTADWRISETPTTGFVQGWANTTYAAVGDTVTLYVSSTAPSFRVIAYRMGYYQGLGARQIWESTAIAGRVQPACPVTPGINMVSCANWSPSASMAITSGFVQGDYLLKIVGSGGQQSYVPLTIWDPTGSATYLFETHSLTAEAWNQYGGFSFYAGHGSCAASVPRYPVCNRARVASFDRPYLNDDGAGDFLGNELPLLQFMEKYDLDVDYVTDVTLNDHPDVMLAHKAFLSLGHDETWTYPERQGLVAAEKRGVNVAFMSAAAIVRHARLQPSAIGSDREVVEYRNSSEDPLNDHGDPMDVTGNTWAVAPTSWPSAPFIGQQYSGYLHPNAPDAPFVVYDASAWIFRGTDLRDGSVIPDVIGSDIDHLGATSTPADLQVFGHSRVPLGDAFTDEGTWHGYTYSDMTYYTDPVSGAGIFDSGTVAWISALDRCSGPSVCPALTVGQMTANLLRLFGTGPADHVDASESNWRTVTPAGS